MQLKKTLKQYYHKKLAIMYWYNSTKAKNRFKKSKDTSGVELLDIENSKTKSFSSDGLPACLT